MLVQIQEILKVISVILECMVKNDPGHLIHETLKSSLS